MKKAKKNKTCGNETPDTTTEAQTSFTIEKDVPIPANTRSSAYPWDEMEPGDSFVVNRPVKQFGPTAYRQKKIRGWVVKVKAIDANSCRVWRVS